MSTFFGSLARLWRERKAVTFAPGFWEALRPLAKSGTTVNATSALECTTALACVQAIACGVAMLPLDIYRPRAGGGRDVATDEPLWEFFASQPNESQTWPEWIETTLMHAVLYGDGISFINRPNPRGPIRELIPLVPGSVSVEQRQGYDLVYHLVLADGRSLTVGREQVFHLRAPSWNAYSGLDATKLAREAIGLALATEEAHARLHANGARPGGILTTDQRLTREQVDELRAAWQQTQGGLSNAMRTAVLSSGLKWEPMGMTGVDAQHIETRRFQIEEIRRAFGVYPAMVGHSDKTSTYASVEQFFIANVVYSLGRWTRRFEERIRVDLMTREERQRRLYAKFSLQALMRGEARLTAEIIELAKRYGRYGYRRVTALLRNAGWAVNRKRVERIWRREGLKVPQRQPKRGRLWLADGSCIRLRPERANHVWAYDFVEDQTRDGRKFRMLCVVDEFTREALAIRVARRLTSSDVIDVLAELFLTRGAPAHIRSDQVPEFIAEAVKAWIAGVGGLSSTVLT